ncbi:hypothetical protein JHN52_01155 [Streptomyces sp. MBT97]|uniref:hypothetical protein n=1 Tax=Streptomyces sp. MBT97 TaxID=2800411 RepID=UPI00190A1D89|nr:hypothetical protein [Streptomyces sp. MBT97]MBK3631588.1 hypothetical protein [Streptomyces sp. MBT97]
MKDSRVRTILHPHHDGDGPISLLHDTGEIGPGLDTALTDLAANLYANDRDEEAEQIQDVVRYVRAVGGRPPVTGWLNRA